MPYFALGLLSAALFGVLLTLPMRLRFFFTPAVTLDVDFVFAGIRLIFTGHTESKKKIPAQLLFPTLRRLLARCDITLSPGAMSAPPLSGAAYGLYTAIFFTALSPLAMLCRRFRVTEGDFSVTVGTRPLDLLFVLVYFLKSYTVYIIPEKIHGRK